MLLTNLNPLDMNFRLFTLLAQIAIYAETFVFTDAIDIYRDVLDLYNVPVPDGDDDGFKAKAAFRTLYGLATVKHLVLDDLEEAIRARAKAEQVEKWEAPYRNLPSMAFDDCLFD